VDRDPAAKAGTPAIEGDFPLWQPFTHLKGFLDNPLIIRTGAGIRVRDTDGHEYLDAAGGLWNLTFGLGDERILGAAQRQLEELAFAPLFHRAHEPAIELARKLVAITPPRLTRVFLATSGSEAVEVAIKVVRGYFHIRGEERAAIVALRRSYHGTYYGSGTLSDNISRKDDFRPNLPDVIHIEPPYCYRCPFGLEYPGCDVRCADELGRVCQQEKGQVAAFVMEPVLGSGGIIVPPPAYFERIVEICEDESIILILDEVATGFGRVGEMFAADLFALNPDVMTVAKGINAGYLPLGATIFSEQIFKAYSEQEIPLHFGSTQNGNPVCCAAASATIDALSEDDLMVNCREMGGRLKGGCEQIMARSAHVGDVRGVGLMVGIELVGDEKSKEPLAPHMVAFVVEFLRDNGLIVYPSTCGFSMFPALNVSAAEVDQILAILDNVLPRMNFN
jgi:adenosylmethionine-8-amino-7-oxononanoate aminotransferase